MKITTGMFLLLYLLIFTSLSAAGEEIQLKDEKDKVSYSVGHQVGMDFKRQGLELNDEVMIRGVRDGFTDAETPLMSPKEMKETLIALKKKIEADNQKIKTEQVSENIAESENFLTANAKKEGTVVLENGLQYRVLQEGTGNTPKETDTVQALYTSQLIDGTKLGSSIDKDSPKTFKVTQTIEGLKQALLVMPVGARWMIYIPPQLAFGKTANTPMAGKTIIFDLELVSIQK